MEIDVEYDDLVGQVQLGKEKELGEDTQTPKNDFEQECLHWRGRILTGVHAHWCGDWDDLPVDETCPEWPCGCDLGPAA